MWIQWVMTVLSGCSALLVFLAIVRHPPSADPELEDLVARRFNHVNRTSHSGVEGVDQPQDLQRLGGVLHRQCRPAPLRPGLSPPCRLAARSSSCSPARRRTSRPCRSRCARSGRARRAGRPSRRSPRRESGTSGIEFTAVLPGGEVGEQVVRPPLGVVHVDLELEHAGDDPAERRDEDLGVAGRSDRGQGAVHQLHGLGPPGRVRHRASAPAGRPPSAPPGRRSGRPASSRTCRWAAWRRLSAPARRTPAAPGPRPAGACRRRAESG